MSPSSDPTAGRRGLTPDCVHVGELRALRLMLKHAGTVLTLFNARPTRGNVRKCRLALLAFFVLYPLFLAIGLYKKRNPTLNFLQRLRFHWARPLTLPEFEGGAYNFVDYLRRYVDGETDFVGSKRGWHDLFVAGGVKTPELYLTIDADTPLSAAERLPRADIVVRPNYGQRGKKVNVHPWDSATGLYDGKSTAEQLVDKYRKTGRPKDRLDTSVLVTRFVRPSNKLPHPDRHQHLRILTVNNGSGPIMFRAISLVQRDPAIKVSNFSRGGELFNVEEGKIEGVKLFGYEQAVEDCLKLQGMLNLVSCGWDVLLADDGPYFLEGNIFHGVTVWSQPWCYDVWSRYYRMTGLSD